MLLSPYMTHIGLENALLLPTVDVSLELAGGADGAAGSHHEVLTH